MTQTVLPDAGVLLHFPEDAVMAERAAQAAELQARAIVRHRFPDGELRLRLPETLPTRVVVWRTLNEPNEKLVELLLVAQAARTLGAGELEVFVRISLPLATRGVAAGLMLAFARAMGEFGATLMIAGNLPGKTQTLSIAVYDAVQAGNDAQALWLTLLISVVCMFVLVVSSRLLQAKH